MPFDIIGAKKAGFSDPQIAQEMAGKMGFDYSGARQSGYSDQQIIGEMLSKSDAGVAAPSPTPMTSHTSTPFPQKGYLSRLVDPANMQAYAKTLEPIARPILEGGGAIGGGIIGSGIGPAGTVGGSALGYAAGKNIADTMAGNYADSLGGAASRTLNDIGTGAMLEMGGQSVGKALSTIADPIINRATPYMQQGLDAAKRLGIPATPAESMGSKPLSLAESVLGKLPGSSGMIQGAQQAQQEAIQAAKQGIANKIGTTADTIENVGATVKEGLAGKSQAFKQKANEFYNRVEALAPQGVEVPTPQLQATAKRMLSELDKAPASLKNSQSMAVLNDLATEANSYDYSGVGVIRSQLNNLISANDAAVKAGQGGVAGMSNAEAGIYKRLKGALQSDINTFSENTGGEFKAAYDTANAFYGEGKKLFNAPIIRRVMKSNPEAVVNMVMRPNSATDVKMLQQAVGPDAFQTAKEKFTSQLLADEQNGLFSVAKFANKLDKFDPATISAIYHPDEIKALKDLASVKPVVQGADKMAGNPSGTAQNMMSYAQVGTAGGLVINGIMTGDPKKIAEGATVMFAPAGLAKLYLSPIGRRYLTGALKLSGGQKQAAEIVTKLISIAGVENLQPHNKQSAVATPEAQ